MSKNKALDGAGGRFTDVDSLLPLFTVPDNRGSDRWRQAFGVAAPRVQPRHQYYGKLRVKLLSSANGHPGGRH